MYYPDDKDFAICNAKLTDTLSCASEFEFNMPMQNQMYEALEERISMIQIMRDSTEVFYGEVREIKESLDKTKSIYCAGELAFLFDSTQPQARYQNVTPEQFYIEMLNIHNSKVEEKKRFYPGIVTVRDSNNSLYRYTNGEDTLTAIRKKLCEPLGGYLRIRKENGKRYLDLIPLEEYGISAEQPIQFGRNLLKYNSKRSGANISTVCVPRGAKLDKQVVEGLDAYVDIKSVNAGKDYVINEAAYETYGWIEKLVEWKDITQPENLLEKAQEWVNNNQYRVLSLELKAVDLAELNTNMSPYKVGDMIHAIAEPFGMDMWFPLMKKVTYINDSITNDVTLSYQAKMTYTSQQNNNLQDIGNSIPQETDLLIRAKENATTILDLASKGNIHYIYDEDGRPVEMLVMDTNDINTAQKVWRWNINGLGYSKNGYAGPYALAMTMDGRFVADAITVDGLVVGKNVTMGEDASILWKQITDAASGAKTVITKDYIETLKVKAGSVDAENITGTTITGKTISGGSIAIGSNFSVDQYGQVIAKALSVTGGNINISSVANKGTPIILTDVHGRTIEIGPWHVMMKNGSCFSEITAEGISCGEYSGNVYSSKASMYYDGSATLQGVYNNTTTDAPNVHVWSNGFMLRSTSSSQRYKTDITEELSDVLNPQKLYSLPVKSFKYKDDYLSENDTRYKKDILGFIAEDVAEIYECAVQYDENGQPEMWNSNVMIPALLKLIQQQNDRIKALEERIGD